MSDTEMEMSPKSEPGSDHSEGDNPPTPGSYKGQDDERDNSEQSDGEESSEIQTANEGIFCPYMTYNVC